ncbi:phosphotransferase enzyme family protein [Paenibacillus nasutitermitis]|uniref:Aminoglycoside phosphotransferase domain-containing protein n=1 Tax=Paenibacillus nasutitermitis TaxID=1652958 RepID=A0A916YRW1_9BACL|nr:phosphotransferase [Paenibacillus nasutitermitis]GGD57880.1 hypothetical protein GCM10010911_14590 [Paenibacillus nasutitermitis]
MSRSAEVRVFDDPIVREEIFSHLEKALGITVFHYTPNFFGLYNRKWMVATNVGELFIKCYHPRRYDLTDVECRTRIEHSQSVQQLIHEQAHIATKIWLRDGNHIMRSDKGHYYVVMQHFQGNMITPGMADSQVMNRIGQAMGQMHRVMSGIAVPSEAWRPSLQELSDQWRTNYEEAGEAEHRNNRAFLAITKQGLLLSDLDLSMFDCLQPGWAHWDCWADNLLVGTDGSICFVDFDKVRYSYPAIDIARILLSGSLHHGQLRQEPVQAFLAGYREIDSFPVGMLPLALKLLWCREAHWWLKNGMDESSVPPKRFAEEMIWLTEHWHSLESCLKHW